MVNKERTRQINKETEERKKIKIIRQANNEAKRRTGSKKKEKVITLSIKNRLLSCLSK